MHVQIQLLECVKIVNAVTIEKNRFINTLLLAEDGIDGDIFQTFIALAVRVLFFRYFL